jgi:nitrite reductase/ring-hydroxylating ferredoxin subunit
MSQAPDRVARFVDAILRDRRPPRFPADLIEGTAMVAAALLRSARPGAGLPREEFLKQLERRLTDEISGRASARLSRRRALELGASAAVALVAGVAIDRALSPARTLSVDRPSALHPSPAAWVAVVPVAAVAAGQAVRFSAPEVEGFVINHGDRLEALSAVCTHMGCILKFNPARARLDCPCHGASFSLGGAPLNVVYLRSLPQIESRVREGLVEVLASTDLQSGPRPPAKISNQDEYRLP